MMKPNDVQCNFSPGLPGQKGIKGDLGPEGPSGKFTRHISQKDVEA